MGALKDMAVGLLVVTLQITIFRHLRIFGLEPDITILLLFWWMSVYPRTRVLLLGFAIGFVQDMLLDWWGLAMIAKTVTVMALYGFLPRREDHLPGVSTTAFYLTVCVLLHQSVLVMVAELSDMFSVAGFLGFYLIGNTVFTVGIGLLAQLLMSGRRNG